MLVPLGHVLPHTPSHQPLKLMRLPVPPRPRRLFSTTSEACEVPDGDLVPVRFSQHRSFRAFTSTLSPDFAIFRACRLLYAFGWRANCILPRMVIHTSASAITVDMTGVMPSRFHVDTPVKQAHTFAHRKVPC